MANVDGQMDGRRTKEYKCSGCVGHDIKIVHCGVKFFPGQQFLCEQNTVGFGVQTSQGLKKLVVNQ